MLSTMGVLFDRETDPQYHRHSTIFISGDEVLFHALFICWTPDRFGGFDAD